MLHEQYNTWSCQGAAIYLVTKLLSNMNVHNNLMSFKPVGIPEVILINVGSVSRYR